MNILYYHELKESLDLFDRRKQRCDCEKIYINTIIQYNIDTRESTNNCNAIVESNLFDGVTFEGSYDEVKELLEIYFKTSALQILETCLANEEWFEEEETKTKLFQLFNSLINEKQYE